MTKGISNIYIGAMFAILRCSKGQRETKGK